MFGKQMSALQLRKDALLLESDLNRLRLRAEMNYLREAVRLPAIIGQARQRLGAWSGFLAPLTGFLMAMGLGRSFSGIETVRKGLAVAPLVVRLWRAVSTLIRKHRD